jgi:hypothetical protein
MKLAEFVLSVHLDDPAVNIPEQIEGFPVKRIVGGGFGKF